MKHLLTIVALSLCSRADGQEPPTLEALARKVAQLEANQLQLKLRVDDLEKRIDSKLDAILNQLNQRGPLVPVPAVPTVAPLAPAVPFEWSAPRVSFVQPPPAFYSAPSFFPFASSYSSKVVQRESFSSGCSAGTRRAGLFGRLFGAG